jgi:hypothetical protein
MLQSFGSMELEPSFPNFENGWNAIVLVFQALTLENWAQVSGQCIAPKGSAVWLACEIP